MHPAVTTRDPRRVAEGFALGAAAHDDRAAERARTGLTGALESSLCEVAQALAGSDRQARRGFVRELLGRAVVPSEAQGGRPPRALGLLATSVPRARGREWLSNAPPPRTGYVPDPRLLAVLRRLTAQPAERPAEPAGGERA
jgi:hypothetical protein